MSEVTRPALRYHGGKWMLAPWIIDHFPPHRCYVEPFSGAASVLLRKDRTYSEVYNDLDGEIVNLFRVLRDRGSDLVSALRLTPFARDEYRSSFEPCADAVEQARRTVIRSFMGFGSNALLRSIQSGFRANSSKSGTTPALDWANYPDALGALVERMRGVVIENKDAVAVMRQHDAPSTLHYVDPPYVHSTRMTVNEHGSHGYNHELTDAQHVELAAVLHSLEGMVVLSGYPSDLYDRDLFADWHRVERAALADGARARVEVLWLNQACRDAWTRARGGLFAEVAA